MTILVLTTEPPPLPGFATTGAGLRAWGLTFGLRASGLEHVVLGYAADSTRGTKPQSTVLGVESFERGRLAEFIEKQNPSAVVLQHWGLGSVLPKLNCPLAIDLAGPHLLERALWGSGNQQQDRQEKIQTLSRADYVVCSGQFQRHYFLPYLLEAGFQVRPELCPVIPFSVSPSLPPQPKDRDLGSFIQSGFFLPWQNPTNPLRWTLAMLEEKEKGRLRIIGGAHPSGDVSKGQYDELLGELEKHDRVSLENVLPFDELVGVLTKSGVALDLFPRNLERELAFPTRTIVYLWAGLPVIHNHYDELAPIIEASKCGWTVDPDDQEGLNKILRRIISHPTDLLKRGEAARELVREQFTWDKTTKPLAQWCKAPAYRKDKPEVPSEVRLTGPKYLSDQLETNVSPKPKAPQKDAFQGGEINYSPPTPDDNPPLIRQAGAVVVAILAFLAALVLLLIFAIQEFFKRLVRK
ncbi:MAG: hypothetical protein ACFCU1_08645 [Sumerlaeia bacterium]